MKEEVEKKAVELTDEEMDNIAGGKAIVIYKRGGGFEEGHCCEHPKVSKGILYSHIYDSNYKICHFHALAVNRGYYSGTDCLSCKYYCSVGAVEGVLATNNNDYQILDITQ